MSAWSEELAFAMHLADLADPIAMGHFRRDPSSRVKDDGTIVTEADEAVERVLREALADSYPADAILGEEQGGTGAAENGRRWIIDPIDGTKNYAWGIPVWATLIALEADGEIVAGVVSAPALAERYDAARGTGARRNGSPISVSSVADMTQARVGYGSIEAFDDHGSADRLLGLVRRARASRGLGDFWGHMMVAAGHLDVMAEPEVSPWDIAALLVIVEEAGGRVTDLGGERRAGGSVLTTNGALHDEALRLLAG